MLVTDPSLDFLNLKFSAASPTAFALLRLPTNPLMTEPTGNQCCLPRAVDHLSALRVRLRLAICGLHQRPCLMSLLVRLLAETKPSNHGGFYCDVARFFGLCARWRSFLVRCPLLGGHPLDPQMVGIEIPHSPCKTMMPKTADASAKIRMSMSFWKSSITNLNRCVY